MKSRTSFKRILSIVTFCVMLLVLMSMTAFAESYSGSRGAEGDNLTCALDDEETLYFGLNTLTDPMMRGAYQAIFDGVQSRADSIDISAYKLTRDQFNQVYELYRYDHSEQYWFPNQFTYYTSYEGIVTSLVLKGYYSQGFDDAAFEAAVSDLLRVTEGKVSEYDKALALHNALVRHITYAEAPNAHNAYGAIVGKRSVCEGYAEAYQVLLQRVGIQSYIVTGTGNGGAHAWNLVRLDGKYYYCDVTWDDPTGGDERDKPIYYPYFNITTARLEEDHDIIDNYGILPNCTDESMMYKGYAKLSDFTVDTVAAAFRTVRSQRIGRIYNTGSEDFITWLRKNIYYVAAEIGITGGYGVSYSRLGRESYVVFTTNETVSGTVSGTVTSYGDAAEDITIELWQEGVDEASYTTTVSGNKAAYAIDEVAAGTYTVKVRKKNHVTRAYSMTVGDTDVTQDVKIHLLGDVTGDGKVNAKDHSRLYAHISKTNMITDAYALLCADVTRDGKVNAKDHSRLYAHINKTNLLF